VHTRLSERIERIVSDSTHGASWLAKEAVETLVDAAELGIEPSEVARELVNARPAIGAIAGAVGRVLAAARSPEQLVEEAHALLAGRERAPQTIAVLLREELAGKVVMTHSASATAREALLYGEPPARVVCTVSEPVGEGRWFSEELRAAGLAVDLVLDEDAAAAVTTVDLLLVGADTVFRDGSVVNKIGTESIAEAAVEAGVPVVVACEVIKVVPSEPRDPDEERFDLTPAEHVTKFVTEEGVFTPEDVASLVDRTPFLVEGYELVRGAAAE
jgi:translation initiation factor 2B subunit (eIF-2B alpha/beta/delta family)